LEELLTANGVEVRRPPGACWRDGRHGWILSSNSTIYGLDPIVQRLGQDTSQPESCGDNSSRRREILPNLAAWRTRLI
jgi:hypothetical protein